MRAANFKDEEAVRSLTAAADDPSAPGPAIGDLFAEATGPPVADADGEVRYNNGATTTVPQQQRHNNDATTTAPQQQRHLLGCLGSSYMGYVPASRYML